MNISMVYDGGWWGTHSRLQGKEEHHLDLKQRREQLGHPNSTHWALQPEHQGIPRLCRRHRHTVDSKNTWTFIYESLTDSIVPTWITLSKFGTPGKKTITVYIIQIHIAHVYIYIYIIIIIVVVVVIIIIITIIIITIIIIIIIIFIIIIMFLLFQWISMAISGTHADTNPAMSVDSVWIISPQRTLLCTNLQAARPLKQPVGV